MSTFDDLDDAFKVSPTKALDANLKRTRKDNNLPTPPANTKKDLEDDFQEARDMLKRNAEYSEEAVKGILHIAKNSDHPRAYEVAGQLIKTMQENAKDMLEVQERKKKVDIDNGPKQPTGVTNNNLFVGSTKDLLRALNKQEAQEVIEHDS